MVFEKIWNPPGIDLETNSLCLTDWAATRWNFRQEKDFYSLNGQLLAMPVRNGRNNRNPQYETLSHHDIKELKQAIKDSGLSSPYFNNVVKSTFNSYDLVPVDCCNVASMILSNFMGFGVEKASQQVN